MLNYEKSPKNFIRIIPKSPWQILQIISDYLIREGLCDSLCTLAIDQQTLSLSLRNRMLEKDLEVI